MDPYVFQELESLFNERVSAAKTYINKLWSKEFDSLFFDKERRCLKTTSLIGFIDTLVSDKEKELAKGGMDLS